jgi:YfiH family protein
MAGESTNRTGAEPGAVSRAPAAAGSGRAAPRRAGEVPFWELAAGEWRVRFYGRGAGARAEGLEPARPRAWLRQVHGDRVVEARPGACGEGDALRLAGSGIAACVATADCVPVALVGGESAALVHAGWRGVAAGVVERALEELGGRATAFLGPAIGPCCYEVGDEVAAAVVAASDASARIRPEGDGRPRLALHRAIEVQLGRAGARLAGRVAHCTRCRPEWLWSYRRDREGAGRNWSLLWREG